MQDIIRETGLSAGAIYRYFASKEDIIEAVAAEHRTPDSTDLEETRATDDPIEALRILAAASFRPLADGTEQEWRRLTVQLWAESLRDARVHSILREGYDPPLDALTKLLTDAHGMLPEHVDPRAAAQLCASMFYGLVLQQAWDPTIDVPSYLAAMQFVLEALSRQSG